MAINIGGTFTEGLKYFTDDGIPYVWSSGDDYSTPSAHPNGTLTNRISNDTTGNFGSEVDIGCGRVVVAGSNVIHVLNSVSMGYTGIGTTAVYDFDPGPRVTSVSVGGGRIVVGCQFHDIFVDGQEISNAGSAYLYDLDLNPVGIQTIRSGIITTYGYFGSSTAIGCGRIVIGSDYADGVEAGSYPDGRVFIYDMDGNPVGVQTLSQAFNNDDDGERFGASVAVGNGRIVVGAPECRVNSISDAGKVFIYDLNGNYIGILTQTTMAAGNRFGSSVAVGCGRIAVSAPRTAIGGNNYQGEVELFDLERNHIKTIQGPFGANSYFGGSVGSDYQRTISLGNGRLVIGCPEATSNSQSDAGKVAIYNLNGDLLEYITTPGYSDSAGFGDKLGWSVCSKEGIIVLGEPYYNYSQSGPNGKIHFYTTPHTLTVYDAIDLNYG